MNTEQAAVWARMTGIYDAFLTGDTTAVDAVMADHVTIWDSAESGLVRGVAELKALRSRRNAGASDVTVIAIDATDPVIDIWDDTALLRHLLRVRFAEDRPDEHIRNTSVWRRVNGEWCAVHNHEDVLPDGP